MRTLLLLALAPSAFAQPTDLVDTTPGGATIDGTADIAGGEYATSSTGINAGFGGAFGGESLGVDSTAQGAIQFGLSGAGVSDFVSIYIDSVPGGIGSTGALGDASDAHRAASSGAGAFGGASADLDFAQGFGADYVLTCDPTLCVLFRIDGTDLTFVALADQTGGLEVELPGSAIGLAGQGSTFRYVATLGNPRDGGGYFRSDEFHGVSDTTVTNGNLGYANLALADDDFNSFTVWCNDPDGDGVCADADVCMGDDATGDDDGDGVCNDNDVCYLDDAFVDSDANGICDPELSSEPMLPGASTTMTVVNAEPGSLVLFFVSLRGVGAGPCAPAAFGGACIGVLNPIELGRAQADDAGEATLTFTVPGGAPAGADVFLQAIWASQGTSEVSNVLPITIDQP
jgi:hypothetical protein